MSWYGFIRASAALVESGEVLVSKYATAGPDKKAVQSRPEFIVYNDVEREITFHATAVGAAHQWDKINRRYMGG